MGEPPAELQVGQPHEPSPEHHGSRLAVALAAEKAAELGGDPSPGPTTHLFARGLEQRRTGQLDESEKLLSQGFNALKLSESPAGLSEKQKDLAGRLAAGQVSSSFEEWKTANSQHSNNPRLQALIRSIAELSLLGYSAEIEGFNKRLIELGDDTSALSSMRFDSLTLDVAAALADAKQRAITLNMAKQADTELASTAQAASATLRQQIAIALKSAEISTLKLLIPSFPLGL